MGKNEHVTLDCETLVHTFIITFIPALVYSQTQVQYLYPFKIVGSAGFEPTTSGTQNPNHTKLDHDPEMRAVWRSPI